MYVFVCVCVYVCVCMYVCVYVPNSYIIENSYIHTILRETIVTEGGYVCMCVGLGRAWVATGQAAAASSSLAESHHYE